MLNLKRGKRVFSVILVAVMLFAAVFAVAGFSSAEKSNGEMLLGNSGVGSIKLSATEAVDTTVIYENQEIFESLTIVQQPTIAQDNAGAILVTGKVNGEYANVADGDIGIRIGEDAIKSHIMELPVDADGEFELEILLNAVFCSEYDNKIPVIVSYTKNDTAEVVLKEIPFVIGVITYDYATGALRYPAGAEYVSETGVKLLDKLYVPADAKVDNETVTVMYNGFQVSFKPNPMPVAEAPSGNIGSIADVSDSSVTLNTVPGLEYGYVEVSGSIGAGYGSNIAWVKAEGDTMVINLPTPGTTYTYWVRTPGVENELLPSAAVLLAKCNSLTDVDSDAKDAFLAKYNSVVVNGKELYSSDDPAVTATKTDTLQLLSMYNGLSDEVKALDVISIRGKYLVLSNYLAKHQNVIAAAEAADAYDELRADFGFIDINEAYVDLLDIANDIKAAHWDDEADGAYILKLSLTVQKMYTLLGVEENDAAKDTKYEAVDYIYDTTLSQSKNASDEQNEAFYDGMVITTLAFGRDDSELILFMKKYEDELNTDEHSDIATIEAMLSDMMELEVNTERGMQIASPIYESFNEALCDLYVRNLDKLLDKYDDEDAVYDIIDSIKKRIKYVNNGATVYLDYPESKALYDTTVRYSELYDECVSAINKLEALKDGRSDEDADILDGYISSIGEIFINFNVEALYVSVTPDAYLANGIDAIKLELIKATKHIEFIDKKAAAKAEIEALKDNNSAVIEAANKYLPEIDVIEYDYNNVDSLNANIDAVVVAAKTETGFEKKRAEVISVLADYVAAKKASGLHSASQLAQLDSYFVEAAAIVNNLDYASGKTLADIEAQQAAAIAKFATVNVITVSAGNVPYTGDLSAIEYPADYNLDNGLFANVTNINGFSSALTLNVKMATSGDKLKVDKVSVATGELTNEQAVAAVKNKNVIAKLNVTMGDVSADNGLYTVKVLLPADVRGEDGIYVVSQSGDTTYVYETTLEGNFLVFKAASLTEFLLVGDRDVNLTWLIVLLAVLLVAEIAVIVFFIVKRKKGATVSAIIPFLAIAYVPAGVVPAVLVLGALTVIGGAVVATNVVQETKKKKI